MTDKITITITRNCDADGVGGTIVDEASAVLGSFTNGTPILDVIAESFAEAYGLHEVDKVPVSPMRNVSYRLRQYMTEIVAAYGLKKVKEAATILEREQLATVLKIGITIIDTVTETPAEPG